LTRAEIERVLLNGFFPACDVRARPYRTQMALRDWGLPYASDSAVTRHLADFLRDHPRVDAVLFNGGSLHSPLLRQKLREQIGAWQGGSMPLVLENTEPALAVARGAARSGRLFPRQTGRIAADAAHAVFLEVQMTTATHGKATFPSLVCLLPHGASPEELFEIAVPGLELRTDRLVSFQTYSSSRHSRSRAGDILPWRADDFHALPPLQTIVRTADPSQSGTSRTVPVRLAAKINSLGLLQVSCISVDPATRQSWPLEFNLRPHEQDSANTCGLGAAVQAKPNATADALEVAKKYVGTVYTRSPIKTDKVTAAAILKSLERIFGLSRSEWNAALLRALWPAVSEQLDGRKLSVDHEEAWLILAGFLLRPGFGVAHDNLRIDELWRLRDAGLCFPGRRIKYQEYILWRRVAGGLTRERQVKLLDGELDRIRSGKAPAELVHLAGSLERIPHAMKAELINTFIDTVVTRTRAKQHCAPYLAALGFLLNRAPLYAGPETVVSPDLVAHAYAAFQGFDWTEPELLELQPLFLRAVRVIDDRSLDVPKPLRYLIAGKLESAGVALLRTGKIKAFTPVGRAERISLYGESLPPGLVLGTEQDDDGSG
jgi:hypothetical protein